MSSKEGGQELILLSFTSEELGLMGAIAGEHASSVFGAPCCLFDSFGPLCFLLGAGVDVRGESRCIFM